MHRSQLLRTVLAASLLYMPPLAFADEPSVDILRVEAAIASLEPSYGDVASTINCSAATLTAHRLICEAKDELALMVRLDQMAAVYAFENALGREADHDNPPVDEAFAAKRDACNDTACLRDALIAHTNDSLGGESPYQGE